MMKAIAASLPPKHKKVMGVDASTTNVGIAIVTENGVEKLYRLKLPNDVFLRRLSAVREWFSSIVDLDSPSIVMVEAPIMVQNPLSTKHIAYVVGVIFGECLMRGIEIVDVSPMDWKLWMGYKRLTKKSRAEMLTRLGPVAGNKEILRLRKSQIQDILRVQYPQFNWDDDNLADAAGIALYCYHLRGLHSKGADATMTI